MKQIVLEALPTLIMTPEQIRRLLFKVFPQRSVKNLNVLSGGLSNTNIRVDFEANYKPVVIRVYRNGARVCRKELALYDLLSPTIRVPRVLHAAPEGIEDSPAFMINEYVIGATFQELKRTEDLKAIQQASYSAGATLASIGGFTFEKPGRLEVEEHPGALAVGQKFIDGPAQVARLMDTFLASANCERRAGPKLIQRLHDYLWSWSSCIPHLEEAPCLVHNDFGNRNILVRQENGKWVVAAILDWEFAFSGSPLLDVGHFLRYERSNAPLREPHFSQGFVEHGGQLPDNWRETATTIDLTGIVECLTHDELPVDVESELLELINATLDHREPNSG
ncbi:MAG TPA: phosphotransferase [Pyrinomonadaceae bacterium]|nr:phosphotransferase [Pyrinomonadaceae bacterium]